MMLVECQVDVVTTQVFDDWRSLAEAGKGIVDEKKRYDWGIKVAMSRRAGSKSNLRRYTVLLTVMVVLVYGTRCWLALTTAYSLRPTSCGISKSNLKRYTVMVVLVGAGQVITRPHHSLRQRRAPFPERLGHWQDMNELC